ncbi:hypothetical protein MAR_026787 [Mya arenaria]|uniref:Uncharacterized protein n=1 Tax=Mya arenaria TaxID=6604 RepID=A0ABY7ERI6_MYAAR|nr:hypothetical protein MAR_026787 [Mya arenaria]
MGGSNSSHVLTSDDVVDKIRPFRNDLSDLDRRLFNFAKFQVVENSSRMDESELFLDFENRDAIIVKPDGCARPKSRMFVGYDHKDDPKMIWEELSLWRRAKAFIVRGIQAIVRHLPDVLAIGAKTALKAISFY